MAQLNENNKGFWENFRIEFSKIVWPTREQTIKKTIVVLVISLALMALVYGLDKVFEYLALKIIR